MKLMSTSHSGVLALISLAGLGAVLVLVGLFSYGSRYLRLVAEAEQYLASTTPIIVAPARLTLPIVTASSSATR